MNKNDDPFDLRAQARSLLKRPDVQHWLEEFEQSAPTEDQVKELRALASESDIEKINSSLQQYFKAMQAQPAQRAAASKRHQVREKAGFAAKSVAIEIKLLFKGYTWQVGLTVTGSDTEPPLGIRTKARVKPLTPIWKWHAKSGAWQANFVVQAPSQPKEFRLIKLASS